MLESISIRNFALLEGARLLLDRGVNVITGETGAGKSILIGALSMVLGERIGREIVRSGEKSCEVEAVFLPPFPERVNLFLNDLELGTEELLLRRVFEAEGRSRSFINERSVTLATLKELGDMLVDIHSQNEHQEILDPSRQIELLDTFGGHSELRESVSSLYYKNRSLMKEKEELMAREEETLNEAERLRYEINEVDSLEVTFDLEEILNSEYRRLMNSGRISEGRSSLYSLLYESDGSIFEELSGAARTAEELSGIDKDFLKVFSSIEKALAEIENAAGILRENTSFDEDDPQSLLKEISDRKDKLISLKLKFGPEVEDIIKYRKEIGLRINELETFEERIGELEEKIKNSSKKLKEKASLLMKLRSDAASKLSQEVNKRIRLLGMPEASFRILVEKVNEGLYGGSSAVFLVITNPGIPEMDLKKVLSGGEISRIMLAIKSSLAGSDEIPLLVFDEIDAGLGSDTASYVAEEMKRLAEFHSVIAVTHLPPIAAASDRHIRVSKNSMKDTTITDIKVLDEKGRLRELARMLGGEEDAAALAHARELLKNNVRE